jgi:predicted aspartyl protease
MPLLPIPLVPAGAFLDLGVAASRAITSATNRPASWRALIDTGADMTAISPAVVAALRPQFLDRVTVQRAVGGLVWHNTYLVRVRFGGRAAPGQWFNVEAVEVLPATPDVDVLIGMDLLLKIDMAWNGPGRLVLLNH